MGLSSYILESPSDSFMLLSLTLIDCSADWLTLENNEKATLHKNMPYIGMVSILQREEQQMQH